MSDTFFPIAQQENIDREFDVVDDFSMYCKFRFNFSTIYFQNVPKILLHSIPAYKKRSYKKQLVEILRAKKR